MALPIEPPYPPMEALSVENIPSGKSWRYEPKWDGFRCLAFKDGLYDEQGLLYHVGFTFGFCRERRALLKKLDPLIKLPGFTGDAPSGPSRWSTNRSSEWQPLSPKLVVEVQYDHFTGNRFRHGTNFLRWRRDKAPKACSMNQVESTGRAFAPGILTAAMTHKK